MLQILVPDEHRATADAILDEAAPLHRWSETLGENRVLLAALLAKENVEGLMDSLESRLGYAEGFRLVLIPVEATLPRAEERKNEEDGGEGAPEAEDNDKEQKEAQSHRISREELYADVKAASALTRNFIALVVLSTVVAAFGLMRDSPAVIIGAMVMAPLLGPNVGLALASALGDAPLAGRALRCNVVGAGLCFVLAVLLGLVIDVDPAGKEVASRTVVGALDVVVALAAGIAGCLAFTSGLATSLIGVMVAVALLPPLVVCGLLLGAQEWNLAYRAVLLVLVNVTALNLAGVGTFLVQGIRPASWWEKEKARRASIIAAAVWAAILAVLALAIYLSV